jgi:hypothetical protein
MPNDRHDIDVKMFPPLRPCLSERLEIAITYENKKAAKFAAFL